MDRPLKGCIIMRLVMFKILSAAVVAVWVGMFAMSVQDGGAPQAAAPAKQVAQDHDRWMGIYLDGAKTGYAHDLVQSAPDGYKFTEEIIVTLKVMNTTQGMRVSTVSRSGYDLALQSFDFSLASGVADMTIKGVVKGKSISLDVDTAGRRRKVEVPVSGPVHMVPEMEMLLERVGYEPGRKFSMPFFDPSSLSVQKVDVLVEGKEELKLGDRVVPVYRVRQDFADVTVRSWISPELGTVKAEGLMGFTFLMETKEQATKPPDKGRAAADIIALVSVPAVGCPPEPRSVSYMKASLDGASLKGLDISGGRQTLDGRVVSIGRESMAGVAGVRLPVMDKAFGEYLASTPFVQADDPRVAAKSREIIKGETDGARAARMLSDWVYASMKKRPSAGIPSAVEVLGNMQGDCNEHTVLFTALARSAGIPTRMAAGLVMMGDRFYYHAWPEVYLGVWVGIDPTFGQFPADATHIRFVTGGPDRQLGILKLVGNLKVDILEHR